MKTQYFLISITMLVLSACQATMPRYESEFGESVRNTLNAQVIDPEAANNTDPVAGLDGRAARDAIHNYQKSFSSPASETDTFNIGVGNTNSAGNN
ncbi:MAG: hypothetical protein B7X95_08080 [Methylophilaceae bacterium 17-44-8]|jgi:hypothetical protein|nr:MAG: hypothetical protein B7X95_08080 [Methylophilaceae bacterium 17-44-8]